MYDFLRYVAIPLATIIASASVAYLTARHALRQELEGGRLRLLEITRRYFLSVINSLDDTRSLRTDSLSKLMHVNELTALLKDLEVLIANPFFTELVRTHPLVSKLIVQIRRELTEHQVGSTFALNKGSIRSFGNLHALLLRQDGRRSVSDIDNEINKIAASISGSSET